MKEQLNKTVQFLINHGFGTPEVGIILGTGLGQLVEAIKVEVEVSYNHIPFFPTATVEFHQGKFLFGELSGKKVVVMQGRFHVYEGYTLRDVTYPVRIMEQLGIKTLLISNAAGAINLNFKKGELMLINDHINLQGSSPLAFKGVSQLGERFVDMSAPYDLKLNKKLKEIANKQHITLHEGVYASVVGPQLETRAEYRMLNILGADAVGMSTVPEVIVANHLNLKVVAVSVITDECNPDDLQPVNIQEIIAYATKAEPNLVALFKELMHEL
ncbi:MAG: purine-nucleoside phosphorylase [Flavobacteriaceae bacterium CG_4_8_14_3_um_filter_34_10]|nr:purine-nucleoside phosphorylase [Flavobacteriia bacterium]OIP51122.1 MAG: purine-nucleoside phosphorylase [Flavobacteriaceae bacterium CG2_30_34_30]PIQ16950.1 MAG: purine-nucleoside phosphorylase [Flavobacteriaceae bacterium CG18_big_fil_WC_8_21_14_2_50_34_36]PIV51649.1 MAG: purine-nucleoside phosphorylase [Flavobacteriaceae bacterium CG02_land_8_20_14_3_00_34_13]PIX09046.1 MAG: purine-nucleoside phosphorylase [Flavobacteriaceae bacterium CG_4_8_14_3_um_filter_34_10]PIZ06910.1 MAG: purine-n